MEAKEIRWRIERLAELLPIHTRKEALEIVNQEAHAKPWRNDSRPAPKPLMRGMPA